MQLATLYAFTADSSLIKCFGYVMPVRMYPFATLFASQVAGDIAGRCVSFWGHVSGIATGLLQLPFVQTKAKGRYQNLKPEFDGHTSITGWASQRGAFPGEGQRLGTWQEGSSSRRQAASNRVEQRQGNQPSVPGTSQLAGSTRVQRQRTRRNAGTSTRRSGGNLMRWTV